LCPTSLEVPSVDFLDKYKLDTSVESANTVDFSILRSKSACLNVLKIAEFDGSREFGYGVQLEPNLMKTFRMGQY